MLSPEQLRFLDAADRGDGETVRAMLAAGVDVNTPDPRCLPRNRTALMHAAKGGHLEVVEVLLAAGAKVDAKDKGMGITLPGGNTALLLALENKQVRAAQRLLNAGADPTVTRGGMTVFGQAASLGDVPLIRQLLKLGLNPNRTDSRKADLPLASALFARQTEAVRALLSARADPNLPGARGVTPLEIALREELLEAVQLLLHRGADPNHVSPKGLTPLMAAVQCGQKEIVKALLQRDAAVNTRGKRGRTALDLAQQRLDQRADDDLSRFLHDRGLSMPEYLTLFHEIAALLRNAGGRGAAELPPEPRPIRSKSTARKPPGRRRPGNDSLRVGVKDFLELAHYTEPEFSVIAIRAPADRAAAAFADLRGARQWEREVPIQAAGKPGKPNATVTAVVKVKRNPWTIIFRSTFCLGNHGYQSAVEDAQELSARLQTRAVAFIREKKAETVGYDLFGRGRLWEHAQWMEESSVCRFRSRFRRKPGKGELGEDFTDKIFRKLGIYLPACYPQYRRRRAWLSVEKVSARTVQRADVMVLPKTRKKKK
jgi:ankyrin repeat protein